MSELLVSILPLLLSAHDKYMNNKILNPLKASGLRVRIFSTASTGFSLIELLVTIAILGILVSLAVPSYLAFVNRERASAVRTELLSWIELVRLSSSRKGLVCEVSINSGTFSASGSSDPVASAQLGLGSDEEAGFEDKDCAPLGPLVLSAQAYSSPQVVINSSASQIIIFPRGTTQNTENVDISIVAGSRPPKLCLRLAPLSGAILKGQDTDSSSLSPSCVSTSYTLL